MSLRANWRSITQEVQDLTAVAQKLYPAKIEPEPEVSPSPLFAECFKRPVDWDAEQVDEMRKLFDDIAAIDALKRGREESRKRIAEAVASTQTFTIQVQVREQEPQPERQWVSKCSCQYPPRDPEELGEWHVIDFSDVVVGARVPEACTGWMARDYIQGMMKESDDMGSTIGRRELT